MFWQVWSVLRGGRTADATVVASTCAFTLLAGGLFAINKAISGEWNYQGGDRDTYYVEFPFQNDVPKHELGSASRAEGV